ncbi:Flp family type IVb pilin [Oxalobacteraceae bacterium A2-2]
MSTRWLTAARIVACNGAEVMQGNVLLAPDPVHTLWEPMMSTLLSAAKRFARDERGITAIEYGLIAAVMAAAIAAAFKLLGPALQSAFKDIADTINPPATP